MKLFKRRNKRKSILCLQRYSKAFKLKEKKNSQVVRSDMSGANLKGNILAIF